MPAVQATPQSGVTTDEEAVGKVCGIPTAKLQGKSWTPSPSTGVW
jgi:hypothetical protein